MNPIVVIPARMASTRLPGKPLAAIAGIPMIVRVWRQAMKAQVGPVLVAAAEPEIADAIKAAGGTLSSRRQICPPVRTASTWRSRHSIPGVGMMSW